MHSKISAFAAGVALAVASVGAQAMPAGSVNGLDTRALRHITLTGGGCGPHMEPGPGGICHRIARPVVVVRPVRPVVVLRPVRPVVVVRPVRPVVVVPRRVRPRCGVRVGPIGVATPC